MPITQSGLVYETCGSATQQPIVFIHGGGQVRQCWDQQFFAAAFQDYYRVRFDLSQHGESRDVEDYGLMTLGQDVNGVMEALHLHRPVLIGWSMAGLAICSYIEQYGATNIGGLVFVDAFLDADTSEVTRFMKPDVLAKVINFTSTDTATYQQAIQYFVDALTANRRDDQERYKVLGQVSTARLTKLSAVLQPTPFERPTLENIGSIPTLLVHGTLDVLISVNYSRLVAQRYETHYHEFEKSGHSPFAEEPEDFNAVVARFLETYITSTSRPSETVSQQ